MAGRPDRRLASAGLGPGPLIEVEPVVVERPCHLRLALEAWTSALALAPGHEPSRRARQNLRERIDREVAELVRRGWEAHARGARPEARRLFRAALALDPDSYAAQDAIRAVPAPPASDFEARI